MAEQWTDVPINVEMFRNIDEDALRQGAASLENAYVNEQGGHTRFPGLEDFVTVPSDGRVYLHDWRGDAFAVTSLGGVFRVSKDGTVEDVTGTVPGGGGRVTFAKTDDQLVMAAGGQIVQFAGGNTKPLSRQAPESTHIAYLAGFLMAIDGDSQRWIYSAAGQYTDWSEASNFFSAEYRPDRATSLVATEFGELLVGGPNSIEQFEPYPGGDRPFSRRWSVGEGLHAPYTLIAADNGVWCVNALKEFVRFSGQQSRPESHEVDSFIEGGGDPSSTSFLHGVTNWDEAWAAQAHLFGQKFIILSIPNKRNEHGTEGVTMLLDYRARRWSFLYGWDEVLNTPKQYPVWSYHPLWEGHYFGGDRGKIYRLTRQSHAIAGVTQRMFFRSAHLDNPGKISVDNLRLRLKRGVGSYTASKKMQIRVRVDNGPWKLWQTVDLGRTGQREPYVILGPQGVGYTFQWEYRVTDDCPFELARMQVRTTRVD